MTREDKSLVVAMELLRQEIHDSAAATAANTQRSSDDLSKQADLVRGLVAEKGESGGKGKLNTLGFGRDEGFGNGVPYGLQLGKDRGRANGATPNLRGGSAPGGKAGGGPGGMGIPGGGGPFLSVMNQVAGKFAAIVGPAAILGAVLSSQIAGFQVLGTAVKVLAGAIAPILLPAVVALSAGVLALSEVIFEYGLPIMSSWFDFILGTAIPAIEFIVDMFEEAATGVQDFAEGVGDAVAWIKDKIDNVNPFSDDEDNTDERTVMGARWSGRGAASRVDSGLTDTLRSLRMSMGPKAQISGIGDVGRQVQMAAINNDPLEARLMKMQLTVLEKIERSVSQNRTPRRVYDPSESRTDRLTGAGDYEGGTSAGGGGDYGGD